MAEKAIAKSRGTGGTFQLTLDQEALQKVVKDGRVLELAATLGREAAAQISAQIVDQLALTAVGGSKGGVSVSASFIFDGGDFGTVPPRPKFGIGVIGSQIQLGGLLQQLASSAGEI